MSLRVLGCSGAIAAGFRTTSFLLDERVLMDAGTGVGDLTLEQLERIDQVLLTHSHLDHILSLPLLADSVMRRRRAQGRPPIEVMALPQTVQALREHLFNNQIWPDFTRLPTPEAPVLCLRPIELGQRLTLCTGRGVEVLPAAHTVPGCGYALRSLTHDHWLVFTGDTGPCPAFWERLHSLTVSHLIIEVAFGDDECWLASVSGHHCPTTLTAELRHLRYWPEVWLTHMKPGEAPAVLAQLAAQPAVSSRPRVLEVGQTLHWD
ncbi:MBL fold metallo-hydrolase [Inhella gelatinilytica]|uniref:3',5'-cyclic-nucleotide phosphodiesterase n=1 Tax=Inhella gelatinilytica TaxID=2795030 RepID=A0A931ITG8_9BURK|nr:3',5'-cyclic-nucleotide phosphodiesterase [Inhella gelatinilytica]MBH9551829.1 3',5'-cyclic-nucleotide phosphodiesterase [Inhella gelatinilytica]